MKLTISKNANINYLARIVQVDTFHPHPNADKLKLCTVEGYIISTGIDSVEGIEPKSWTIWIFWRIRKS